MPRTIFAAIAALTIAACSGDICAQTASVYENAGSKASACFPPDSGLSVEQYTSCDQNACEKALPSCSADDQQTLQAQLNCQQNALNKISADCGLQSLDAYETAAENCAAAALRPDAGTVSLACDQALATQTLNCGDAG